MVPPQYLGEEYKTQDTGGDEDIYMGIYKGFYERHNAHITA